MKLVGLTGGIGCGKSTVASRLRARGADVIDVDILSRELQQPGQPLFDQIVERWGPGILDPDGGLDREALGRIVFGDREQLVALTMMAAPITEDALINRAMLHHGTDDVVVLEAAQFMGRQYGMEGIILVDAPVDVALIRLTDIRGMSEADARARMASQLPREQRLAEADFVIDNRGGLDGLDGPVAQAWAWIQELPDSTPTRMLTADPGSGGRPS
ncbi:MAG TPA: dephospho-CoA kinase [Acidimicrobiales bacterium]